MNGINMNQFVLGFAIARPLAEQRDRLMVGLAASMFPASNPYGAIFLKPQVDAWSAKESEVASLKSTVSVLQAQVTTAPALFAISETKDMSVGDEEAFDLKVAGAAVTSKSESVKAEVDAASGRGKLTAMKPGDDVAIDIAAAGLTRTIKRSVIAAEGARGRRRGGEPAAPE